MTATFVDRHPLEAADPDCIDPADAATALAHGRWQRLAVIGDSVTAGVREPLAGYRDRSMTDRLADALAATRPGFATVNLARAYLRTAEIQETQLEGALAFGPDLVVVSAGANDAFSRSYDSGRLYEDLDALLRPLAEAGALIVSTGLFDLPRSGLVPAETALQLAMRWDEVDALQRFVVTDLGGVHAAAHEHPRGSDPAIYASDGIHVNARGQAIAFALLVAALTTPCG